jgi:hypothetical protein
MMVEENLARRTANHETAAGDVPGSERMAREAGRLPFHEHEDLLQVVRLRGVCRDVPEQRVTKGAAGAIERHGPDHDGDLNSPGGRSGIIPECR